VTNDANIESGMGSEHLYATSEIGRSIERSRYDYSLVNALEENTEN